MLPGLKQFAIGLTIIAGGSIGLGDEKQASLYSDVQTRTVFSVAGQMTAESTNSRRVASLEQLKRLLTDGGFESTSEQGAVSFSKALGPWKFPFSVSISDDETTLEIILALSNADAKNVTLERLLALMEANRKQAPSQFVYNASQTRIELYRPLKNENISGQLLRDQINAMAIQAKESDSLWKGEPLHANIAAVSYSAETNVAVLSGATSSSADSTAPAPPPKSAVTDLPSSASENGAAKHAASQLIGRWSASRSLGNAFALMFDPNGNFVLVNINEGRQTRSTGNFSLSGNVLSLDGSDGLHISGTVDFKSSANFELRLQNNLQPPSVLNFQNAQ